MGPEAPRGEREPDKSGSYKCGTLLIATWYCGKRDWGHEVTAKRLADLHPVSGILNRVLVFLIRIYQVILSPFLRPACRFTPSCSHYAVDALNQYPIHRALLRILYRLLRCNPFYTGGYDPVRPENTHTLPVVDTGLKTRPE